MRNKKHSSLLCIPDTNSLIHMRDIDVANKRLWLWLWEEFDVGLSETICDELHRHSDLTDTGMEKKCEKSIWNFRQTEGVLKKLEYVFAQYYDIDFTGRKDKGECHNCCVALDAILSGKYQQVIFLTNELKTTDPDRNGRLFRLFKEVPLGRIWSSLDFVLYLYTRHKKLFLLSNARDVIRDVNVRMGGKTGAENNVMLNRLKRYYRKLNTINQALSQLPSYKNIGS